MPDLDWWTKNCIVAQMTVKQQVSLVGFRAGVDVGMDDMALKAHAQELLESCPLLTAHTGYSLARH